MKLVEKSKNLESSKSEKVDQQKSADSFARGFDPRVTDAKEKFDELFSKLKLVERFEKFKKSLQGFFASIEGEKCTVRTKADKCAIISYCYAGKC